MDSRLRGNDEKNIILKIAKTLRLRRFKAVIHYKRKDY